MAINPFGNIDINQAVPSLEKLKIDCRGGSGGIGAVGGAAFSGERGQTGTNGPAGANCTPQISNY